MEIMMPKGKSVKVLLFLIGFISSIPFCFSQKKLKGVYKVKYELNDFSKKYSFNENGGFSSESYGNLGLIEFGKGHYTIKNDTLFLNYNLTKLKEDSFHKSKKYYNSKDSIQIRLNIHSSNNIKPLFNVQIWSFPEYKSTESDKNGNAFFKFIKEKRKEKIEIHIDGKYLAKHIIYIGFEANYDIEVFMSKSDVVGFGHTKALKNEIIKYEIIEINNRFIKIKKNEQNLILNKE